MALEPIISQDGDVQTFLDESTATLAATAAAFVAGGTALAAGAEALIFGQEDASVEKATEEHTVSLHVLKALEGKRGQCEKAREA